MTQRKRILNFMVVRLVPLLMLLQEEKNNILKKILGQEVGLL